MAFEYCFGLILVKVYCWVSSKLNNAVSIESVEHTTDAWITLWSHWVLPTVRSRPLTSLISRPMTSQEERTSEHRAKLPQFHQQIRRTGLRARGIRVNESADVSTQIRNSGCELWLKNVIVFCGGGVKFRDFFLSRWKNSMKNSVKCLMKMSPQLFDTTHGFFSNWLSYTNLEIQLLHYDNSLQIPKQTPSTWP